MAESIVAQVTLLRCMTVGELRTRYAEVFGEEPRSRNKDYLWKRIAYRIQELAEGSLSERAKGRARELARDTDLRVKPPKDMLVAPEPEKAPKRDPRLPAAGATLKRVFNGKEHVVQVFEDAFEYNGSRFPSLSAIAREITGTRWNGFLFFGIAGAAKDARR
ncbi:MAG: DUF2924 domain-containing protein [Deltaproteobacteria bacterium]|nr:DUF2924 domain-containing protein [Deltaproteobacteria bacterium]